MNQEKYIGMDVHQATISVAVMDAGGKLIMECLLETKAATIVEFIRGLQGTLSLTFEEGTSAAWLHDLLKPHVSRLVVCDPRKNALLKDGNKSDRIDARKLAELLRGNQLHPVYHGEHGVRTLKELGRSYLSITQDVTRVMNRIKALYRSWAIPCAGTTVYAPRHRAEWLAKIAEPGVRVQAERLYQQLDLLQPVRLEARCELLVESHQHSSHLGTEDCRDQFNHLEERSGVRPPTITSTSSLSISEEQAFPSLRFSHGGGRSGSGDARFEGEYQSMRSAPCASAPSHPLHAMPPRITRNSDRPRASDRTMVAIVLLAASFKLELCHQQQRSLMRMDNEPNLFRITKQSGLDLEKTISTPVEAELFP